MQDFIKSIRCDNSITFSEYHDFDIDTIVSQSMVNFCTDNMAVRSDEITGHCNDEIMLTTKCCGHLRK